MGRLNSWDMQIMERTKLLKSVKCKPVLNLLQLRLTRLLLKRVLEDLEMQIELREQKQDMFIDPFWIENKKHFEKVMDIFGALEYNEMKKIDKD